MGYHFACYRPFALSVAVVCVHSTGISAPGARTASLPTARPSVFPNVAVTLELRQTGVPQVRTRSAAGIVEATNMYI